LRFFRGSRDGFVAKAGQFFGAEMQAVFTVAVSAAQFVEFGQEGSRRLVPIGCFDGKNNFGTSRREPS